ncbi:hypothetical protein QNA08_12335 [Chelatococcus sp. SYSU_G07232]|uniref:Lipoprotein n=1 Tax=Chelatococcus albus TaxID=3047466 RepID=A0ABT7AJN0_9HYPH|nr:hypothetical protein [Chelatococcus sp. SYSU_G07232]MDJ1159024.1 hypothetical protein [Chelatococcus sp. SYSU_G07232]
MILAASLAAGCVRTAPRHDVYTFRRMPDAKDPFQSARVSCDYESQKFAVTAPPERGASIINLQREQLYLACMKSKGFLMTKHWEE